MDMVVCFLLGSIALSAVIIAVNVCRIYKRFNYYIVVFIESFNVKFIPLKCVEDDDNEKKCI